MKYLKKYKLFESYFNEAIIHELNDILLELTDLGYFVDLTEMKGSGILNPDKIRAYMESEDFTILNLLYSTPEEPASHFSISLRDYKNGVLNGNQNKEIGILHHLQISFTPK